MGLFDEESDQAEKKSSKWKETAATIGGCFLYIAFPLVGITLIFLIIRGVPWIAENIYPWISVICAGFVILALPISILLAFFKKTREVSAIGFLLSSYLDFIHFKRQSRAYLSNIPIMDVVFLSFPPHFVMFENSSTPINTASRNRWHPKMSPTLCHTKQHF